MKPLEGLMLIVMIFIFLFALALAPHRVGVNCATHEIMPR